MKLQSLYRKIAVITPAALLFIGLSEGMNPRTVHAAELIKLHSGYEANNAYPIIAVAASRNQTEAIHVSADYVAQGINLLPEVKREVKPGQPAPVLQLEGADGKNYRLGGKRNKPLLLNFWASWCDPCKLEAPDLQRLALKYKKDLDIYGVNVTAYDDESSAKAFARQYGLTFPILFDRSEKAFGGYGGAAFPTLVLLDKNGIVRDIVIGLLPPEKLEEKIRGLTGK